MTKLINKTFVYAIINICFSALFLSLSLINFKVAMISSLILFTIYLCLLNEQDLITNQIILLICMNVIYDILWRKTSLMIPLELKYLVDFISIILLFKIIIRYKKYKLILKDKLFITSCIFIIFSSCISFSKNISIINYLMSLRIYIRFLPIYIVLSINELKYNKYDFYLLILSNIILIPIQMRISSVDDVSGVFGASNVHGLLLLLIVIASIIVTLYSRKKINLIKFIIGIILIFIILGVGEIKIGLAIIPIIILITFIMNSFNPIKLVTIIASMIIMGSISINILIKVAPDFSEFFYVENLKQNIINYTMRTNNPEFYLGRLENIVYSHKYILINNSDKVIGLGVGGAMPSETYYYELPKHSRGRERAQLYLTDLYKESGPYLGYQFSSMNIIYLENGYIGLIMCFLIIISTIISAIKLLFKSNKILDKCIASSTISLMISLVGLLFYYNYILDRSAMLVIIFLISLNKNKINRLNKIIL